MPDDDDPDSLYPTEATLQRIQEWPTDDLRGLLNFIRSEWNWDHYAWREGEEYHFATGGWSGNESLIGALSCNVVAYSLCWVMSRRGGKHVFEIPESLRKPTVDSQQNG